MSHNPDRITGFSLIIVAYVLLYIVRTMCIIKPPIGFDILIGLNYLSDLFLLVVILAIIWRITGKHKI